MLFMSDGRLKVQIQEQTNHCNEVVLSSSDIRTQGNLHVLLKKKQPFASAPCTLRAGIYDYQETEAILNMPPPRGSQGYDFSPIISHYVLLFTFVLAIVSRPGMWTARRGTDSVRAPDWLAHRIHWASNSNILV
jgi:hypothetical protein